MVLIFTDKVGGLKRLKNAHGYGARATTGSQQLVHLTMRAQRAP